MIRSVSVYDTPTKSAGLGDVSEERDRTLHLGGFKGGIAKCKVIRPDFVHRTSIGFVVPTSVGIVDQVSNRTLAETSTSGSICVRNRDQSVRRLHRKLFDHLLVDRDSKARPGRHGNHSIPQRERALRKAVAPWVFGLIQLQQWRVRRKTPMRIRQD